MVGTHIRPLLLTLAAGVLLASAVTLYESLMPYHEYLEIGRGNPDFKTLSNRFTLIAREKGAVYAFEVLKRAQLPPNTDFHLLGHIVGDELYKQKGIAGIADCTQDFRNACSHSIVIGVFNEFGASGETVKKIDAACVLAPGGKGAYGMCYHGLGHGVLAYFGYEIPPTVSFCERLGTRDKDFEQSAQCVGGAIMELVGGGFHDREAWAASRSRVLQPSAPLSPCTDSVIPERAKGLCLSYLTPWLWELAGIDLGQPDPGKFSKAFAYCDTLPASRQKLRDACFGGFGKEFIPLAGARDIRRMDQFTDAEYRKAISWCEHAGPDDGKRACIEVELDSVFWGGENDPAASFRFCALVDAGHARDACYKQLAGKIKRYLPQRLDLCGMLPETHRKTCFGDSI